MPSGSTGSKLGKGNGLALNQEVYKANIAHGDNINRRLARQDRMGKEKEGNEINTWGKEMVLR